MVASTLDYIKMADIVFYLHDLTQDNISTETIDNILLKEISVVNIYNKIDLIKNKILGTESDILKNGIVTSALTGLGVDKLKKHIITALNLENVTGENFGITTPRQYKALKRSDVAIAAVIEIANHMPVELELVSFELQNALQGVEDLLGTKTADEILDKMFNSFCVGK